MGFMGFGLATSFNVYALDRCRRCMENARNAWKTQLSIENFTIFPAQSIATKAGDKTSSSWKQKSDARLLRNCCFRTGVKSCGGLEAHLRRASCDGLLATGFGLVEKLLEV